MLPVVLLFLICISSVDSETFLPVFLSIVLSLLGDLHATHFDGAVSRLIGRVQLGFSRQPFSHWSLTFTSTPQMEVDVTSRVAGRSFSHVTQLVASQVGDSNNPLGTKSLFICFKYLQFNAPADEVGSRLFDNPQMSFLDSEVDSKEAHAADETHPLQALLPSTGSPAAARSVQNVRHPHRDAGSDRPPVLAPQSILRRRRNLLLPGVG